jgi:hypothetical protein
MDWQERLLPAFFCTWQRMPTEEDFFLPNCEDQIVVNVSRSSVLEGIHVVPDTCLFTEVCGFEAISSRMFGFRRMVCRLINSQC